MTDASADSPPVVETRRGAVLQLTLSRPDKLNAIDLTTADALADAVTRFGEDPALRVLLIRAEGRFFCAGADLTSPIFPDPALSGQSRFRRWYRRGRGSLHPLLDEIEAVEKPVVAAHQGPCLGGGLELSLACDFRLAARAARYGLPETALGGLPGSGGLSRLVRIAGPHWARWLILASKELSADQALSAGLVHEVFEEADFADGVDAFCDHLAAQPPEAVAAGKLAIELAADLDRAQARNMERMAVGSLVMGEEYAEAIAAVRARLARKRT